MPKILFIYIFIFLSISVNLHSKKVPEKQSFEVIELNQKKEKVPSKKIVRKKKFMFHWWVTLILSILFVLYVIIKRKN